MVEEWRTVGGWPDYEVSNLGRVKRVTSRTCAKAGTILRQCWRGGKIGQMGYLSIDLSSPCRKKQSAAVHVLVATAFLGQRPEGLNPNHRDGKRSNNRADNLEWITQSANVKHAYALGLADAKGERNGQAKLMEADVIEIRLAYLGRRGEQVALGRRFGVHPATIRDIVNGRTWTHVAA